MSFYFLDAYDQGFRKKNHNFFRIRKFKVVGFVIYVGLKRIGSGIVSL